MRIHQGQSRYYLKPKPPIEFPLQIGQYTFINPGPPNLSDVFSFEHRQTINFALDIEQARALVQKYEETLDQKLEKAIEPKVYLRVNTVHEIPGKIHNVEDVRKTVDSFLRALIRDHRNEIGCEIVAVPEPDLAFHKADNFGQLQDLLSAVELKQGGIVEANFPILVEANCLLNEPTSNLYCPAGLRVKISQSLDPQFDNGRYADIDINFPSETVVYQNIVMQTSDPKCYHNSASNQRMTLQQWKKRQYLQNGFAQRDIFEQIFEQQDGRYILCGTFPTLRAKGGKLFIRSLDYQSLTHYFSDPYNINQIPRENSFGISQSPEDKNVLFFRFNDLTDPNIKKVLAMYAQQLEDQAQHFKDLAR